MANECIPVYEPGQAITAHCDAAVTGKQFVRVSATKQPGSTLTPSGADTTTGGNVRVDQTFAASPLVAPFGVADRDAAIATKVGVLRGGVVPVTAGTGGVTAGANVMPGTDGRAVAYAAGAGPDTPPKVGVALVTAAAGAETLVALSL